MTTLEDLKKRATAAEAVLIERVEALVAGQAKTDARRVMMDAIRAAGMPDVRNVEMGYSSREHPFKGWVETVIRKIEATEP
jgi:hypothetical protein